MIYYHVDVFSFESLSGNGLTVIFHERDLEVPLMQKIAQEFKQFETIFLKKIGKERFRARIFTVEEELDFNFGVVEDVATGSAAGPVGAYLYKWNIYKDNESILINQGRFVGRPSRLIIFSDPNKGEIYVAGDVKIVAKGELVL